MECGVILNYEYWILNWKKFWTFAFLIFDIVSDFDIRISDLFFSASSAYSARNFEPWTLNQALKIDILRARQAMNFEPHKEIFCEDY